MSFTPRLLNFNISLANGQFQGGGNSAAITGLRSSVRIHVPGGSSKSTLEGIIYGLPLSMMNQLSTVGTQFTANCKNTITVQAGDATSGMATVYDGTLFAASVDASDMPRVGLRISGMTGLFESTMPTAPVSIQGSGDVATMMQQVASTAGWTFENNGVSTKLANPYYPGPPWIQALSMAQHAGIGMVLDNTNTLAIWPAGQSRQGSAVMISPQTGMVGYPEFDQNHIEVKTVFDPTIKYAGQMQVQSDLTPACGTFNINDLSLALDSMTPHGQWFAMLRGTPASATNVAG